MNGPRFLKNGEFASLTRLLDIVFPHNAPLLKSSNHDFTGLEKDNEQHIVFEDNGEIVSHLGVLPRDIRCGKTLIRAAGVGYVATYEKYRGQGLMNKMFLEAEKYMAEAGFLISILEGDRKRYANFGWERGARRLSYNITDRFVKGYAAPGITLREYSGSRDDLAAIRELHEKEYYRTDRNELYYSRVYDLSKKKMLIAEKGGKLVSYLNWVPENQGEKEVLAWIYEYAGDPEGIKAIFREIFASGQATKAEAVSPVNNHILKDTLLSIANTWDVQNGRMIRILDLSGLLTAYMPHIEAERNKAGLTSEGEVTLRISETGQSATMQIGRKISVTKAECKTVLELNRLDMVRLIFGLVKPSEAFELPPAARVLDTVFPLDMFLWLNDSV